MFIFMYFFLFLYLINAIIINKEAAMTKHVFDSRQHEYFEYHGNTAIEHVRKRGKVTISRKWLLFDSVEEAQEFFNSDIDI